MFLELIATVFAGIGAAGVVMMVNSVTGGRLPRWLMPMAAGAAMFAMTVSSEYSWASRTVEQLPEGLVAFDSAERSDWFRPWSYFVPVTFRVFAVAPGSVQTREDAPDARLVDVFIFERWSPQYQVLLLVRCSEPGSAIATPATLANPQDAPWQPADDRLIEAVC